MLNILTTTYNRKNLLKSRIESALNQIYGDFKMSIVDDCSEENIKELVLSFKDSRIKYYRTAENLGSKYGDRIHVKKFFNTLSEEDFFIYAPDDDYWPNKNFFKNSIELFSRYPTLQTVMGCQITEYYENVSELKVLDNNEINKIIVSKNKNFHYFGHVLPKTGFYKKEEFLEKFSRDPLTYNISDSGTIYKKKGLTGIGYFQHKIPSKWQAGFEMKLPPLFLGDIFFINDPCTVVRAHKTNISFNLSQIEHFTDTLLSVKNGFSLCKNSIFSTIQTKNLIKYKKIFIDIICNSYLNNSIHFFKNYKLSLCSQDNTSRLVNPFLVIKEKILTLNFLSMLNLKLFIKYYYFKFKYLIFTKKKFF